ncbi:PTS sugar transporter subunit IIC [Priestia flexa]|jgi:fructose-specific phosphotransferase system IIC component|uniref:PTS sugar transporter subunit IIC n=1 Tax=Priestia flexa TaxID=86664 RepID=A0A8I1MBK9_9BACI|nr:PTS sugar transporter subunit IIC [Priestia flexa]MBN8250125.1 PTS sugar transporter subunit IIC [Priestia flexa]MBN8434552.1 PTS sugar transporter subunit IIC [Priestia flexa]MCA0967091.1 PTS sugar transporter subunit IIC [Priestia flexa]QCS52223.1 PTS sugar transporter subunit IIC [Priestia flexa]RIV15732.1 PTS sugar transporter subunit IIC [Priestia flexa]
MEILKGTALLLLVLFLFWLFSNKAPYGMKAMGALASGAVAAFLVEAFQLYVGGDLLNIKFLGEVGEAAGGMGGVAAAALVALALGVSPVYALMMGVVCSGLGLLPGFFAGYIMAFAMKVVEKKAPAGLDLLGAILVIAPLTRLIATGISPLVDATLLNIGSIIKETANANPILMGIILGGVITVVATAPLSSMALTAMLGLTGLPMAIGALAVFGSSFMNYVLFDRLKFGDRRTTISVAVEPLTQANIISANPIPIYVTNFVGGAVGGVIVSLFGLVNDATGTATPIAGLAVMYGFNDPIKVTICAALCAVGGAVIGYIGSIVFKNFNIKTVAELEQETKEAA